ncbi:MAG: RNase adapter RapZ [Phascolarctobacterium sp.]|nr:RNase adapter RapZ [Acidaminococcaceae bacterium]MBQ7884160.1 RNase adapter RapZ [Phascolarctobacterium sp.]
MQTRFLIITGMSGAGKTQVVRTLEDLKYFCIDNLPAALIPKFVELCRQTSESNVALVVDVRGGQFFEKLLQVLEEIKASGQKYELLFLDADDATLVRRYKETRRRHPLGDSDTLLDNLSKERELLKPLLQKATYLINTTELVNTELKNKIVELFGTGDKKERMGIVVRSFGFKYGLPLDSDLVLDVRFLPNPFYVEELRNQTGNDQPVADFISRYSQTFEYLKMEAKMLDFLIPQYISEGKSQLVISVGCTGGQHRSVFVANKIFEYLSTQGYKVEVSHRELSNKK